MAIAVDGAQIDPLLRMRRHQPADWPRKCEACSDYVL